MVTDASFARMLGVAAAGSGMTVARVEVSTDEDRCGIDPLVERATVARARQKCIYPTKSN
jgi:hypothetical protein